MANAAPSPPLRKSIFPYLALAIGILALSFSAMFVRWADAPGPITGFYRIFFAALILLPFFARRCAKQCTINKTNVIFPILGGLFSALDLATWNSSLNYTTASNATLLGNTAPLWVALAALLMFHEKLKKGFWFGLGLALVGAALVMGNDFFIHPKIGLGDLMATAAGIFYAGYYLATQRGRQHLDPITYIWLVTVSASVGLLVINLALGFTLTGYTTQTWLVFLATALVSQIIGYVAVSYALGHLPASVVAPTMIGQPVMTTILAIPLLNEIPQPIQLLGGIAVLAGIFLVHQSHGRNQPGKLDA
jgi:drug/metabolite transporter (DMT)-like permease